ncbi:hypothetical protein RB195_009490 [Necator americanus]|uniref:SH3 domain protein n=1 Tax=Necator americanus TaxID=51031 RepID=A0ABR1CV49_NECAM
MTSCLSQRLCGPVESEYIMNHYREFTNAKVANEDVQNENGELRLPSIMSSEYELSKRAENDGRTEDNEKNVTEQRTAYIKNFVPCVINGNLYFAGRSDDDESTFSELGTSEPSLMSLNRELSALTFTHDQLCGLLGRQTVRLLLEKSKIESVADKDLQTKTCITQQECNTLRTALETLSRVDAKTLRNQQKRIELSKKTDDAMSNVDVENLRKVLGLPKQTGNQAANGETVNPAAPFRDVIAMTTTDQSSFGEEALLCESGREIQGAAELCISPSKMAGVKSLHTKYKCLLCNSAASTLSSPSRTSTGSSAESDACYRCGCSRSTDPSYASTGQNAATGPEERVSQQSQNPDDKVANQCDSDLSSYSNVTADASSILYSTLNVSKEDLLSDELSISLYNATDSWWTENVNSTGFVSSVSTGVWLSNYSDTSRSLCSTISSGPVEKLTDDFNVSDITAAKADEVEIEETNRVFDALLTAKSENLVLFEAGDLDTAKSCSVASKSKGNMMNDTPRSPLLGVDDLRTAIEEPILLHTAWERTASSHTEHFDSENCYSSDDLMETFVSAPSTSGCGALYCSFLESENEICEIEPESNLGSTRG